MRRFLTTGVALSVLLGLPGGLSSQEIPDEGDRTPDTRLELREGAVIELRAGTEVEVVVGAPPVPPERLRVIAPVLPAAVQLVGNPEIVSRGLTADEIRYRFRATRPGYHRVGPLEIFDGAQIRSTLPLLIAAADGAGRIPFRVRWRVPQGAIYSGQSVPILLEIVDIDSFAYPEGLSFRAPQSGLFEEVSGLGSVSVTRYGDLELYEIPVAGFLFTAATPGTVRIPPAEISAQGLSVTGPPVDVAVLPVPTQVGPVNAIGDFSFAVRLPENRLAPGRSGLVELAIVGSGNLPVLEFPAVELTGLVEVDRSETTAFQPDRTGRYGYSGERRLRVRFEPQPETQEAIVRIEPFSAFDPQNGETRRDAGRTLSIEVVAADARDAARPRPQLSLIPVDQLTGGRWWTVTSAPLVWFAFLLGPLGFSVYRLATVGRRGRRMALSAVALIPVLAGAALPVRLDTERLTHAHELAADDRPAVAGVLYDLELQRHDWHAGLHFNRGVLAIGADNPVAAIYHLRRAVRLFPASEEFRDALQQAEAYFDLDRGPAIARLPRPMSLFLATLAVWTLLWGLLSAGSGPIRSIGLISLSAILVAVAAGYGWAEANSRLRDGIVVEDVIVRRIPEVDAAEWVQLAGATPVRVELSYDDFYLIRTAGGVTGWVPRRALWSAGE